VSTARLKKKEVQTKTSKRQKTWLDKKRKFTKKGSKKKGQGSMVCSSRKYISFSLIVFSGKKAQLYLIFVLFYWQEPQNIKVPSDDGGPVQNISPSTSLPKEGMSEAYMTINTFSQLLTVSAQSSL